MKKIHMFAALLAMLLPTVLWAGGGGTTTYDYSATVSVTASGNGTVYVGRTNPSSDKTKKSDTQSDSGVEDTSKTYTFYAFAEPDSGYEFTGWTGGADNASSATTPVTVSLSSSTTSKTVDLTATFAKVVTFDGAEYVIDENGGDLATLLGTVQDGDKIIINKDVTIAKGVNLTIPSGIQVTISSGKKLIVKGNLSIHKDARLVGEGTLAHNWKTITQAADVHVPFPLGTDGVSGTGNGINTVDGTAGKYLVTSVKEENNVTGSFTCREEFFVAVENKASGETYYSKPSTSKPVGVLCTVAREKALNWIDGVSENVYTDYEALLDASKNPSGLVVAKTHQVKDSNKLAVLLTNAGTVTINAANATSANIGSSIDLAGNELTLDAAKGTKGNYQFNAERLFRAFNGKLSISRKVMNVNFSLYNCTGSINYLDVASYATGASLYDSPRFTITFDRIQSTSIGGGLNFFGREDLTTAYSSSYTDFKTGSTDRFTNVYSGRYSSDPTNYLYNDQVVKAVPVTSTTWVVEEIKQDSNAAQVSVNGETESSFADAIAQASQNDVIALKKNIELSADLTLTATGVRINLNGWKISGSNAIINNGDLEIIDENGNGQIDVPVINNGTLLLSSAKYNGLITLNKGFCHFLAGTFNGGIAVADSVEDVAGVAEVCGGIYTPLTYTHGGQTKNLKDLCKNGYVKDGRIAQVPVADVVNPSFASYSVSALNEVNRTLYTRNAARTGYTREEWIELNKLRASSDLFSGFGVDCAVKVDRTVSAKDISVTKPFPFDVDVEIPANTSYSALFQAMRRSGMATAPWTYGDILPGGQYDGKLSFSLSNKSVQDGTLCLIEVRLATGVRNMSGPQDWSYTEYVTTGSRKLVLGSGTSNKAMIRPATGAATFYATLGAAMGAAADGGTVMLANDCTEGLALNKAGTYTFDTMGFAASDEVSVADGLFIKSSTSVDSSAKVLVPDAKATTYVVAQKVASVGGQFYDNLTEAVGAANGATVTLLAATDETITLTAEGQSFTLNKNGIAFDDAKVVTTIENGSVTVSAGESGTVYTAVTSIVDASDGHKYNSVTAAVEGISDNDISVTITANDTEEVSLPQGKTLTVTTAAGVTADLTVTPGDGAFIVESAVEGGTKYESKKITVEMATPQATVEVKKIDHGTESAVTDMSEINAAVTQLMGNHDVPRTDNTDKLGVLDKITVTPTKIVEEVVESKTIIRSATFDVVPAYNAGQSLGEGQKLKFRLPVDAAATQLSAIVYHGTAQFGAFAVQTYNNEKYVEVESADFSPYGYDLLDGETANPVAAIGTTGYATFAEAIEAANAANVDEITILNGATESPDADWKVVDGKLVRKTYVAQIGTTKYETLAEAIAAVPADGTETTITMIADETIEVTGYALTIPANKNVVLDLNGKTVAGTCTNAAASALIRNLGTFTIQDSSEGKTGKLLFTADPAWTYSESDPSGYASNLIRNEGTLVVSGGTLYNASVGSACYAIDNYNSGKVTINGGTIDAAKASAIRMFDNKGGKVTVTDGTIGHYTSDEDCSYMGIQVQNGTNADVEIKGGTLAGTYALYGNGTGDSSVSISGGTFDGGVGFGSAGPDDITISGGTFLTWVDAWGDQTGFVSGGLFSEKVPEEFCDDSYIPTDEDPETGMYTVRQGVYVAQIVRGGSFVAKYETFDAALTDALSGDTVQLLADVEGVTTTYNIDKAVTIDGQGQYKIVAGENPDPRGVVSAWDVSRVMFDMTHSTANVTFKDITLDNGEGHYYSFLARAKDGTNTFENAAILHGAEADASGADGVGYGAAVQVDGGTVLVKGDFYADTHGAPLAGGEQGDRANGIFPFTAFLYQTGVIHFDDDVNADIGQDLLLVGMVGAMEIVSDEDRQAVQEKLDAMNVPDGYYPYTLKVGDNSLTSFTGASPLGWNDIIDYGKEIMTATSSLGMTMDPATTPVEVGLLADTVLPDEFTYEDSNFTINGNGNALSGTIKYTDNAGTMEHTVMGTQEKPLVLDMTGISGAIHLGTDIAAENVVVTVTEEQAAAMGKTIVTWDTTEETDEEAESMKAIAVTIVDENGKPVTDPATGEAKSASIIWDTELGIGYIGPCEARLTGPTHPDPIYTSLAQAIELAAMSGDTVTLLMNIENFSGTLNIDKTDITLDGAGYSIKAAPVSEHRNFINAWAQANIMLKIKGGSVALKNITLDGDATHAYTYLVSADNSTCSLTIENITLLHGGEIAGDANGAALQDGAGYGAAIHLNNGASLTVKDGFYADTHGAPAEAGQTIDKAAGVFPFTGILPEGSGTSVKFDLTQDSDANPTVAIGEDLLLVGMIGAIPHDQMQGILDYMKVPKRFIPYTLTLSDGSAYAFTGASPLGWNDIIDYGKEIMDVSTAIGYDGLDKDTTPVEVGLLTDTALPETFTFADTNFTVNGNGHALSGTIKYTDTAGSVRNIALGSETAALVVDLSDVTNLPVTLGSGVDVANVVVNLTGEQASFGTAVFKWDAESEDGAPQHEQVVIKVAGNDSDKELVWDDEIGVAYIGPCEARLTGPGREPGYMDLTNAFDMAVGGDTVTLFWSNVTLNASLNLPAGTLLFATNKYELALGDDAAVVFTNATTVFRSEMDLLDVIALAGDCANGYWLRHEADGTTNVYSVVERGEYIVTGNTEDGGVGTAVIKVSDEWIAANIGANVRTVNEIDAYLNSTNSTTNLREWEMYVLNQATPFRVTAVGKADNAVSTTLVAPASSETTGFTVAYSLDETLADGSVKTPGTRQASRDFAVPVASVTTHAFYRVRAHLTSGESTLVVDSANTIGVLKATASTAQTIVAVPWVAFGGGDVSVADLLRTDGLSADDELFVYNPSTQNFRAWTLGSGKTWEPTTVIAAGTNATPGDDASSVTVARGSGVLLKRGSVSAPLCFVGEVASGGKTAFGAAQTSGTDGAQSWNLVASPSVEALDIANFPAPSSGGWDRIIVLTSGAPLNLTYKNGKWGYNKVEVNENGMAVPTRVTEGVSIPAGVGFWYLNSGAAREIEW